METVFKSEQVYLLSKGIGVTQKDVKTILDSYIGRLTKNLDSGKSVKFLNICYLINENDKDISYRETLAYISNEIGKETKLGKELVFRVLSDFEKVIVRDVKNFYTYTIRGLVNISCSEYKTGIYKSRVRKATKYDNMGIRVTTINSFKRKVEWNDRKDT